MKKITISAVRVADPSRLLPKNQPVSSGERMIATPKPAYPPVKMPRLPDGFYKGRDQDCL